jgi:hypothetical protein
MTGRDPIFGKTLRAPYAGGTGHSQVGPSQERQEHEDESGISLHRQALVIGYLESAGVLGITIKELCSKTGWHHGQSSQVLSVLDTTKNIIRLDERRERQSVYVLEAFQGGRAKARKRRSTSEGLKEQLDDKNRQIEALQVEVENLNSGVSAIRRELARAEQEIDGLTRYSSEIAEGYSTAQGSVDALTQIKNRLDEEIAEARKLLARLRDENAALRTAGHLRSSLEDDEAPVIERVGGLLATPAVQVKPDDEKVTITLSVVRTLMQVVQRATQPAHHEISGT